MGAAKAHMTRITGYVLLLILSLSIGLWLFQSWTVHYVLLAVLVLCLPAFAPRSNRCAMIALSVVAMGFIMGGMLGLYFGG